MQRRRRVARSRSRSETNKAAGEDCQNLMKQDASEARKIVQVSWCGMCSCICVRCLLWITEGQREWRVGSERVRCGRSWLRLFGVRVCPVPESICVEYFYPLQISTVRQKSDIFLVYLHQSLERDLTEITHAHAHARASRTPVSLRLCR